MSMLSDIKYTLSSEWLRNKLTLEERAQLLIDLTIELNWDVYENKNGEELLDEAINDMKEVDDISIKRGW